ncbi:3-phosphoshikimate 1-carboxyvinyltransferase [Capnocytophaga sp. HP1101]
MQALFPDLTVHNLSTADDTVLLQQALNSPAEVVDIHHAGTAMRFLTAYFAIQQGREVLLTGSPRMKERPIHLLVNALQQLGADITYTEKDGFPPIYIKGKKLTNTEVHIQGNVSSQYISALLLIAPALPNGLTLHLEGELTSLPYLKMTTHFLAHCIGEEHVSFESNTIKVSTMIGKNLSHNSWQVESDWSSASYWYSFVALSPIGTTLSLSHFKAHSLQGDSALKTIYEFFGVHSSFKGNELTITKVAEPQQKRFECNLNATPDIAQTIAVTCVAMGLECHLTGLHTLIIKETNRLQALQNELRKLGAEVSITDDSLYLAPCPHLRSGISIATYNDHRMAMSFAPLMLKTTLQIADKEVVSKSYPSFWHDVAQLTVNNVNQSLKNNYL